jgi:hypothetical protein
MMRASYRMMPPNRREMAGEMSGAIQGLRYLALKVRCTVFSVACGDYFGGSTPLGVIARPILRAYNSLTLV